MSQSPRGEAQPLSDLFLRLLNSPENPLSNANLLKMATNEQIPVEGLIEERSKALDSLMASIADKKPFDTDEALIQHRIFWRRLGLTIPEAPTGAPFLNDDLDSIYELALKNRIKLALSNTNIPHYEEVLKNIIQQHSPEALNTFLHLDELKPYFGDKLGKCSEQTSTEVKQVAQETLLQQYLERCNNLEAMKLFVRTIYPQEILRLETGRSRTNPPRSGAINTVIKDTAIGFPQEIPFDLETLQPQTIKQAITRTFNLYLEKIKTNTDQEQFEILNNLLVGRPSQTFEQRLNQELPSYGTYLKEHHLENWAQDLLSELYLPLLIKNLNEDELTAGAKLTTKEQLKTFFHERIYNKLGPDSRVNTYRFINDSLDRHFDALRRLMGSQKAQAMLNEAPAQSVDQLIKLTKSSTLKEFQKNSEAFHINPDWIDNKTMPVLRDIAEKRIKIIKSADFLTVLDNQSRYKHKAHPALLDVFSELSPSEQTELIGSPAALQHLIRAQNETEIRRYLSNKTISPLLIKKLEEENKRLATFDNINNAVLAKALAESPSIKTNNDDLNRTINENTQDFMENLNTFESEDSTSFSRAVLEHSDDIRKAEQWNAGLLEATSYPYILKQTSEDWPLSDSDVAFFDYYLKLEKSGPFLRNDPDQLGSFLSDFRHSDTLDQFVQTVTRHYPTYQYLPSNWQMPPAVFSQLKNEQRHDDFLSRNSDTSNKVIQIHETFLKNLKIDEKYKSIEQKLVKMEEFGRLDEWCDVIAMTSPPTLDKIHLWPDTNAAYIFVKDELYYVNKAKKVCSKRPISPEDFVTLREQLKPTRELRSLTMQELENIRLYSGPIHKTRSKDTRAPEYTTQVFSHIFDSSLGWSSRQLAKRYTKTIKELVTACEEVIKNLSDTEKELLGFLKSIPTPAALAQRQASQPQKDSILADQEHLKQALDNVRKKLDFFKEQHKGLLAKEKIIDEAASNLTSVKNRRLKAFDAANNYEDIKRSELPNYYKNPRLHRPADETNTTVSAAIQKIAPVEYTLVEETEHIRDEDRKEHTLYVNINHDVIEYTVIAPFGSIKTGKIPLSELRKTLNNPADLNNPTVENLKQYLPDILKFTAKKGHTHHGLIEAEIPAGYARKYKVASANPADPAHVGEYIKQNFEDRLAPITLITLAITPPKDNQENHYRMGMEVATRLIASMDRRPSAKNQITIRGRNADELKLMIKSFLAAGELANLRFGLESLSVTFIGASESDKKELIQKAYKEYKEEFGPYIRSKNALTADLDRISIDKFGYLPLLKEMDEKTTAYRDEFSAIRNENSLKAGYTLRNTQPVEDDTQHRPTAQT